MKEVWKQGEEHPNHKLSEMQVLAIRQEYEKGKGRRGLLTELGRRYGITPQCAWNVVNRVTWRWLEDTG